MITFTFIITDGFEELAPLTLTIEATNLKTAKREAHVKATLKGFDNDALCISLVS